MFRWLFCEDFGLINIFLQNIGLIHEPIHWLSDSNLSITGPMIGMIWYGVPFFGIMILAALQSIPGDVLEAADVDGASPMQRYFLIVIPYIRPTIITTILLRVIWVFNSPDVIYTMTGGGPTNSSSILSLYVFNQAFSSLDFGYAAAVGIMMVIMLAVYAFLFLKITKYDKAGDE